LAIGRIEHRPLVTLAAANRVSSSNTWFLGPTWVSLQNGISIGLLVFAQHARVINAQTDTQADHATCLFYLPITWRRITYCRTIITDFQQLLTFLTSFVVFIASVKVRNSYGFCRFYRTMTTTRMIWWTCRARGCRPPSSRRSSRVQLPILRASATTTRRGSMRYRPERRASLPVPAPLPVFPAPRSSSWHATCERDVSTTRQLTSFYGVSARRVFDRQLSSNQTTKTISCRNESSLFWGLIGRIFIETGQRGRSVNRKIS